PRRGFRRRHAEHRNEDDPAGHLLGPQLAHEPQDRHLTGVLVAVVPGEDEHGGPVAAGHDGDGHHEVRPPAEVVRVRDVQVAVLLAGPAVIDRGPDRRRHAGPLGYSSQPLRYSRRMYWSASGALRAFSFDASQTSFLPVRYATLPRWLVSVSQPE